MSEFKKAFEFFSEIQSELLAQKFVVDYIEDKYSSEYNKVKDILNISIDPKDIFNRNENFIQDITLRIENKLTEYSNTKITFKNIPKWLEEIDYRSELGVLIDFVSDFSTETNFKSREELFENIKNEIENTQQDLEPEEKLLYNDDEIDKAITAVDIINNNKILFEQENNNDVLLTFKATLRLLDNLSACNIYRQSFINIFSIFDAVVFDTLKYYFENNIQQLEVFFNPKKSKNDALKLGFEEILDFNDIKELHSKMVEMRFDSKYLSTLVRLIAKYSPDFFDDKLNIGNLLETINRRNLHIHKKGIVDQKYLSEANPYNFVEGDLAYIDKKYLIATFNIISKFWDRLDEEFNKSN